MDDWFKDPFFGGDMGMGGMHSHFAEMEKHMNDMMSSMFKTMGDFHRGFGLTFQDDARPALEDHTHRRSSGTRPGRRVDEVPNGGSNRKQPIIEEPDDIPVGRTNRGASGDKPETFFYSSAMSAYQGPDGIGHAKKKTYDSRSGRTEMAEMRKLGDQAVAMKREIDRDGRVTDQMDRKNVNDNEVDSFHQKWSSKSRETPKYALPEKSRSSSRRALK
jgi:hypothetical protein